MKKAVIALLLILWFVGSVGGFGYAIYYKVGFPITAGLVIAVLFGIPTVQRMWKFLKS